MQRYLVTHALAVDAEGKATATTVVYDGYSREKAEAHQQAALAAGQRVVELQVVEVDTPYRVRIHTRIEGMAPIELPFPTYAKAKAAYERIRQEGFAAGGAHFLPVAIKALDLDGPEGLTISPAPAVMVGRSATDGGGA